MTDRDVLLIILRGDRKPPVCDVPGCRRFASYQLFDPRAYRVAAYCNRHWKELPDDVGGKRSPVADLADALNAWAEEVRG